MFDLQLGAPPALHLDPAQLYLFDDDGRRLCAPPAAGGLAADVPPAGAVVGGSDGTY
ncbi:hypothetical protein ACTMU2_28740 [Cupriavidus basilensis]